MVACKQIERLVDCLLVLDRELMLEPIQKVVERQRFV